MVAQIGGAALPTSGSITKTNSASQLVAAVAGTDYVTPNGSITGNAATATALASTPTTCAAGNYARGISANGNGTGCTPANAGTVTSVTFTGDGTVLSSTPSAADTSSGTVTAMLNTQTKNTALMGPSSGAAANPTFRNIVAADLPTQALNYWFPGTVLPPTNGSNQPLGGTGLANTARFIVFTLPFNTTISKASIEVSTSDAGQTMPISAFTMRPELPSCGRSGPAAESVSGAPASCRRRTRQSPLRLVRTCSPGPKAARLGQIYTWNMNTGSVPVARVRVEL